MNVVLWVVQAVLAAMYLAGGAYKLFNANELAKQFRPPSPRGWQALRVLEIVGAILLIVPAAVNEMPVLTTVAAAVLAVDTLALAVLFGRRSRKLSAENPFVWALAIGLLAAFVACGRFALSTSA
jgi:uncharacterized membrane protein YphA (DoxX/SURF4 family)